MGVAILLVIASLFINSILASGIAGLTSLIFSTGIITWAEVIIISLVLCIMELVALGAMVASNEEGDE